MKRITIRDVAREAGVSVTLVSFVLNAKTGPDGKLDCPVNPDTASRVLAVARKLGYRKNAAAASLRSGRSHSIAVITTDISNKFFAGISRYMEDKAYSLGYTVFFGSSDEKAARLERILDSLMSYNIDGVILAPVPGCEGAVQRVVNAHIPVVLFDRDMAGIQGDVGRVLLDDRYAGFMAVDKLVKEGFRKIEMISYSLAVTSLTERESGYREAMDRYGLSESTKVHYSTYSTIDKDIPDIINDAKSRGTEAFFLPTYSLSAAVMSEMKHLNLSTPEDFAIIGFDDSNIYNLFSTTVAHFLQPLQELGEKSVEMIHGMIEGTGIERTIVLKPTLIEGGSAKKYSV